MPQWCTNKLIVRGPELVILSFRRRALGRSPWRTEEEADASLFNFHSLVPVPSRVLRAGYDSAGANWARENWGCSSDSIGTTIIEEWDKLVVYQFLTAWFPPINLLQKAARRFRSLTFLLTYDEPDMGFMGIARFKGVTHEDHRLSY